MDDHQIEDDEEREALASIASAPPNLKNIHSQSQHVRPSSKRTQRRKHSLDDDRLSKNVDQLHESCHNGGVGENHNFFPSSVPQGDASDCNNAPPPSKPEPTDDPEPLPEFIGSGAGVGIFKVPTRAAVHPARPPCVELRPHPLKETQVGKFLRNIACTERQLWAGQANGIRFWNLDSVYDIGGGLGGRVRRGEEDAAPFHESVTTSPTMCLIVDDANKLVWTGHKDRRIRSWKMDQQPNLDDNPAFKEGLSWQAHRGPVLSISITSFDESSLFLAANSNGDIWSGSEGGIIKIWPWETIEKSLSLSPEEKHMAALLVERSAIYLKSQATTVNGNCSISSADVKCLLSDNGRGKVWAVTPLSFSLWNARTREFLKVFNIEGQIENRFEIGAANPEVQSVEDH